MSNRPGMYDHVSAGRDALTVVTKRAPTEAEITDLLFADTVAKHVKSNAIVFARGGATVGIGAGQMSRVDSVRIAAMKAAEAAANAGLPEPATRGSVVAVGCVLPVRRQARSGDRGRRHRGDPARRLAPRPRGDRRRRQGRHRHGVHRTTAFPALNRSAPIFCTGEAA